MKAEERIAQLEEEEMCCPHCQSMTPGNFPTAVKAPAQYGPGVQALAVDLHHYQLVPTERDEATASLNP